MTAHTIRRKAAKGSRVNGPKRREYDPRIVASLPDEDFKVLAWWAAKHRRPVAEEIRRAVWAYIHCIRADYRGETA
ncbi:MAG: hypothetical protein RLZZ393_813 [Pseudomonadota bacterium]|jgi:hypothetical protein